MVCIGDMVQPMPRPATRKPGSRSYQCEAGPAMVKWFGLDGPRPTYGRLAFIYCNEQPAVELLEKDIHL